MRNDILYKPIFHFQCEFYFLRSSHKDVHRERSWTQQAGDSQGTFDRAGICFHDHQNIQVAVWSGV